MSDVPAAFRPAGGQPARPGWTRSSIPVERAVVGLALDGPAEPLAPLLTALSRWCSVKSLPPSATAWVVDQGGLARYRKQLARSPLAVWLTGPAPGVGDLPAARVILTGDIRAWREVGTRALSIPVDGPGRDARYMPPVVRSRLRRARGLPEHPVLHCGSSGWQWPGRSHPLPESLYATALGCAAAAVVTDAATLTLALAWGTPAVTSADIAQELEAAPGVHVLDGETPEERHGKARRIASDPRLAARLSWAGRLLWEERYDVDRAATALAAALLPAGPQGHQLRLAELGAPSDAHICSRAADALETLSGAS